MCAFKDALGHCPVARYFIGSVQRSPAQLRHHCLKRHVSHMNRSFTVSIWVHVSVIKYNNWFHIFISPRLPRRWIKKKSFSCVPRGRFIILRIQRDRINQRNLSVSFQPNYFLFVALWNAKRWESWGHCLRSSFGKTFFRFVLMLLDAYSTFWVTYGSVQSFFDEKCCNFQIFWKLSPKLFRNSSEFGIDQNSYILFYTINCFGDFNRII